MLHAIFAPNSAAFLHDLDLWPPRLALDLGCGPGETTRLLKEHTGAAQVVGLDLSEALLAKARPAAGSGCAFRRHDVTLTPFPDSPADLIYGRFLLTHLGDVEDCLLAWAGELVPGGTLAIEETEEIVTAVPAFEAYVAAVERLLAEQDQLPYPGPLIGRLPPLPALRLRLGRIRPVAVANQQAARLFLLNLASWRDQQLVRAVYTAAEIDSLAAGLRDIVASGDQRPNITWRIRQVAFGRVTG